MKQSISITGILGISLWLTACSGGGGGLDIASGGIGGTGYTEGAISGFGSIFVNGIQYDTSEAEVVINGEAAAADALQLGMVVRVEGDYADALGKAQRIEFQADLHGPVTAVSADGNMLQVLGQTVYVDTLTVFEGLRGLADLSAGTVIQVSGMPDAEDKLIATRIASESTLPALEPDTGDSTGGSAITSPAPPLAELGMLHTLRGKVSGHDPGLKTFAIALLTVDYSEVPMLARVPQNGDWVIVSGTLEAIGNRLRATRLERESAPLPPAAQTPVALHGIITRFAGPADFSLGRMPAQVTADTVFRFGSVADLAAGMEITGFGKTDARGRVVLESVELRAATPQRTAPGHMQVTAQVRHLDRGRQMLNVDGVTVKLRRETLFEDGAQNLIVFNLNHINLGDTVSVFGFVDMADGSLRAEKLRREAFTMNDEVRLQGRAAEVAPARNRLVLLGVTVEAGLQTRYQDNTHLPALPPPPVADNPLLPPPPRKAPPAGAASFFAKAQAPGVLVEVHGVVAGEMILADQLTLLPAQSRR